MRGRQGSTKQHGSGGRVALWLLLPPLVVLIVIKTDFMPQVWRFRETGFTKFREEMVHKVSSFGLDGARRQQQPLDTDMSETTKEYNQQDPVITTNWPKDGSMVYSDLASPPVTSKLACNLSSKYSDTCRMEGDLRIHGKGATVYVVSSTTYRPEDSTITIQPYTRKWEKETMSRIREVTVRSTPPRYNFVIPPECTVRHGVPAVVFSTGGCGKNFFHGMSDLVVPLYITAREYGGEVQLLIADYNAHWVAKFAPILAALSRYPVIDLDADAAVRCFPSAHVGLESHRVLGIDPARSRNGYTMAGFRDFLRSVLSLPRPAVAPVSRSSGQKPRLVMVLRRHSRALTNEDDAVAAVEGVGFEVVRALPEDVADVERIAAVVNSCDVMVGVHGAGLTNMVFLPHNATAVQIIPWGNMKYPCRFDFGDPVPDMGLRYVEYEVTAEETTLKYKYPRDHPVFADPISIERSGKMWETFLEGQNLTLDISRFRGAMEQVYQSITVE